MNVVQVNLLWFTERIILMKIFQTLNKYKVNTMIAGIAKVVPISTLMIGIGFSSMTAAYASQAPLNKELKQIAKTQRLVNSLDYLSGTWEGTYTCSQGLTNLKLVIDAQNLDDIDAVFIFSAHPSNPNVPSGSFKMVGTYKSFNSPDISGVLNLQGDSWINRPNGYLTVDLSANVDTQAKSISGNVISSSSSCSTFNITKVKNSAL